MHLSQYEEELFFGYEPRSEPYRTLPTLNNQGSGWRAAAWDLPTAIHWLRNNESLHSQLSENQIEDIVRGFSVKDLPLTNFSPQDWAARVGSEKIGWDLFTAILSYNNGRYTDVSDPFDQGFSEDTGCIFETLKSVPCQEYRNNTDMCNNAVVPVGPREVSREAAHIFQIHQNQYTNEAVFGPRELEVEIPPKDLQDATPSAAVSSNEQLDAAAAAKPRKGRGGRPRREPGCAGAGGLQVPRAPRARRRSGEEPKGHLWQFLARLLHDPSMRHLICWDDPAQGIFKFVDNKTVAKMWGAHKGNRDMTYEKMTRTLRHYENGFFKSCPKQRLYYQFGPKAEWKSVAVGHEE